MTKVFCNADNKNIITNNLNTCINLLNEVNNNFNNLFVPYDFYYRNTVYNLKSGINKEKNDLTNYKNKFVNTIEKINKNELELLNKVNKIDNLLIEKIDI